MFPISPNMTFSGYKRLLLAYAPAFFLSDIDMKISINPFTPVSATDSIVNINYADTYRFYSLTLDDFNCQWGIPWE